MTQHATDAKKAEWPGGMRAAVARLRGITGFVTTLETPTDGRARVFSRYLHIRRVDGVSRRLMRHREARQPLDARRVELFVWAHDLNRWPFAHNAERGLFDPASDIPRYVSAIRLGLDDAAIVDLHGIVEKDPAGVSPEGRLVLLADMIAGFVEDPLLAMAGLDLTHTFVPENVADQLGLPIRDDSFLRRLLELNRALNERQEIDLFIDQFDALFAERVDSFIRQHGLDEDDPLDAAWFQDLRRLLKEQFLREHVFPFNNEKIAHGTLLRQRLIEPLIGILGPETLETLTTVSEREALELALRHSLLLDSDDWYVADLDYVARSEPDASFRLTVGRRLH